MHVSLTEMAIAHRRSVTWQCYDSGCQFTGGLEWLSRKLKSRNELFFARSSGGMLNEDLSREYQAIISYVVYSQVLRALQYMDIADQLEIHAKQELHHALMLRGKLIISARCRSSLPSRYALRKMRRTCCASI